MILPLTLSVLWMDPNVIAFNIDLHLDKLAPEDSVLEQTWCKFVGQFNAQNPRDY